MSNTYITDRISQHPGRIRLTDVSSGETSTVDVERAEGTVTESGTQLNAEALNGILNQVIEDTVGQKAVEYEAATDDDNIESGLTIEEAFGRIQAVLEKLLGVEIQCGTSEEFSPAANSYNQKTISFPHSFSGTPTAVVSINGSFTGATVAHLQAAITGTSVRSMTVRVHNEDTAARTVTLSWIAVYIPA